MAGVNILMLEPAQDEAMLTQYTSNYWLNIGLNEIQSVLYLCSVINL